MTNTKFYLPVFNRTRETKCRKKWTHYYTKLHYLFNYNNTKQIVQRILNVQLKLGGTSQGDIGVSVKIGNNDPNRGDYVRQVIASWHSIGQVGSCSPIRRSSASAGQTRLH